MNSPTNSATIINPVHLFNNGTLQLPNNILVQANNTEFNFATSSQNGSIIMQDGNNSPFLIFNVQLVEETDASNVVHISASQAGNSESADSNTDYEEEDTSNTDGEDESFDEPKKDNASLK